MNGLVRWCFVRSYAIVVVMVVIAVLLVGCGTNHRVILSGDREEMLFTTPDDPPVSADGYNIMNQRLSFESKQPEWDEPALGYITLTRWPVSDGGDLRTVARQYIAVSHPDFGTDSAKTGLEMHPSADLAVLELVEPQYLLVGAVRHGTESIIAEASSSKPDTDYALRTFIPFVKSIRFVQRSLDGSRPSCCQTQRVMLPEGKLQLEFEHRFYFDAQIQIIPGSNNDLLIEVSQSAVSVVSGKTDNDRFEITIRDYPPGKTLQEIGREYVKETNSATTTPMEAQYLQLGEDRMMAEFASPKYVLCGVVKQGSYALIVTTESAADAEYVDETLIPFVKSINISTRHW